MRFALVALALTLPAASSAGAPASPARPAPVAEAPALPRASNAFAPSRLCADVRVRHADSPEAAKSRRLGELPPGDLTLAVVNRVEDCIEPVVVRQGLGAVGGPGR